MTTCCASGTSRRRCYEEMTKGLGKAQIAQEMENRKEGEKLEILDAASLPDTADGAQAPLVISIGAGIGLCWES